MTIDETKALLAVMFAAWPTQRAKMSTADIGAMLAVWSAALEDVDFKLAEKAITRIAKAERWMPSIADVRGEIGSVAHGTERSGMEAWGEVHAAMRKYGQHRAPGTDFEWSDQLVAEVVRSIGWFDICSSELPDSVRARFIDGYNALSKSTRREARTLPGATSPKLSLEGQATVKQLTETFQAKLVANNMPNEEALAAVPCTCDRQAKIDTARAEFDAYQAAGTHLRHFSNVEYHHANTCPKFWAGDPPVEIVTLDK